MSLEESKKKAKVHRFATRVNNSAKRSNTSMSCVLMWKISTPRSSSTFTAMTASSSTWASTRTLFLLPVRKEANIMMTPLTAEKINAFILFYNLVGNIEVPEHSVNKSMGQVQQSLRVNSIKNDQQYDDAQGQLFMQADIMTGFGHGIGR